MFGDWWLRASMFVASVTKRLFRRRWFDWLPPF
jgi:hypothetical protein